MLQLTDEYLNIFFHNHDYLLINLRKLEINGCKLITATIKNKLFIHIDSDQKASY